MKLNHIFFYNYRAILKGLWETSKLISLGHRNPQGILYDKENDILFNAEHGPQGGDEININKNLFQISNFGWPISSYGNHSIDDPKLYELVSLNKSHKNMVY